MSNQWIDRARRLGFLAFWVFVAFSILDLSPSFYGPFAFMAGHKDLAPWFSGTATSIGVLVALINAQVKEASDDRRLAEAAARSARSLSEAACAIANSGHLAAILIVHTLKRDDWDKRTKVLDEIVRPALELAQMSASRLPAFNLRPKAVSFWIRVEMSIVHLKNSLIKLAEEVDREVKADDLLASRRAALVDSKHLVNSCFNLSRVLNVEVEWDFGSVAVFDVAEVVDELCPPSE